MAQQIINIGTVPNDALGDPLRVAYNKINSNFTELYTGTGLVAVTKIIPRDISITVSPGTGIGNVTISANQVLEVDGGQSDTDYQGALIVNGGSA